MMPTPNQVFVLSPPALVHKWIPNCELADGLLDIIYMREIGLERLPADLPYAFLFSFLLLDIQIWW